MMGNGMKNFLDVYSALNSSNLETLQDIYREDISFVDPAHEVNGISELTRYFEHLYQNVDSISFSFEAPLMVEGKGYVEWKMEFSHPRLAKGEPVRVEGVTYLEMDDEGMVYFHRDYFDLGAMLYEHIPAFGRITKILKKRLGR